jgi:large subunit ribosomal protein L35
VAVSYAETAHSTVIERSEQRSTDRRRRSGALAEPFAQANWRERKERRSKMPKMKTKSAAKKRFKVTATGKVLAQAMGKRHGMIKRSNKFIRDARGTMVLAEPDAKKVIKNFLPNGF